MTEPEAQLKEHDFKKQSQFHKTEDERKSLWKKGLRKMTAPRAPQKQAQTKPISDYPCVFESAVYNLVLRDDNGRNFDGEYMKWQKHQKQMRWSDNRAGLRQ
jgi:hypothetical protein